MSKRLVTSPEVWKDDDFVDISKDILGLSPTGDSIPDEEDGTTQASDSNASASLGAFSETEYSSRRHGLLRSYSERVVDIDRVSDAREYKKDNDYDSKSTLDLSKKYSFSSATIIDSVAISPYLYLKNVPSDFLDDDFDDRERINLPCAIIDPQDKEIIRDNLQRDARECVVWNLFDTEDNYVMDLRIFTENIKDYLTRHEILSPNIVHLVFEPSGSLYKLHKMLLSNMHMLLMPESWSNTITCIGYLFLYYTDTFRTYYTKFIDSYAIIRRILVNEELVNSKYASFLRTAQKSYLFGRKQIKDYLILPVQRALRYKMLLKDLYAYTPDDHPDKQDIESALQCMSSLASLVNEKKRIEEGATGLFEAFELTKNCPPTLISSNRSLITDIDVINLPSRRPYKLFLCTDVLMMAIRSAKSVIHLPKTRTHLYKFSRLLNISDLLVNTPDQDTRVPLIITAVSNSNTKDSNIKRQEIFKFEIDKDNIIRIKEFVDTLKSQIEYEA